MGGIGKWRGPSIRETHLVRPCSLRSFAASAYEPWGGPCTAAVVCWQPGIWGRRRGAGPMGVSTGICLRPEHWGHNRQRLSRSERRPEGVARAGEPEERALHGRTAGPPLGLRRARRTAARSASVSDTSKPNWCSGRTEEKYRESNRWNNFFEELLYKRWYESGFVGEKVFLLLFWVVKEMFQQRENLIIYREGVWLRVRFLSGSPGVRRGQWGLRLAGAGAAPPVGGRRGEARMHRGRCAGTSGGGRMANFSTESFNFLSKISTKIIHWD